MLIQGSVGLEPTTLGDKYADHLGVPLSRRTERLIQERGELAVQRFQSGLLEFVV